MEERKTSKLRDIKETASDAVEIMRQIGTPGVLESLNKIQETASKVNEIIQSLQTPEMVKNIENFRLISENMNETSTKMKDSMQQLKETNVIEEATEVIKSVKGKINSFSNDDENSISSQDIREVSVTTKEMLVSIKDLMNELTVTVASSKRSGIIRNFKETMKDASNIYKTTVAEVN
ncbi:MAG: hypothetical protein OEQ12_01115 [Nitrosopumilus sp.]|nr:hypothetical protein [Nitrosopumilus sp.]